MFLILRDDGDDRPVGRFGCAIAIAAVLAVVAIVAVVVVVLIVAVRAGADTGPRVTDQHGGLHVSDISKDNYIRTAFGPFSDGCNVFC
jgi:hypothetical protein